MKHCKETESKMTELRKKKHMKLPLLSVAQCIVGNSSTRIQFKLLGFAKIKQKSLL